MSLVAGWWISQSYATLAMCSLEQETISQVIEHAGNALHSVDGVTVRG